MENNELRLGFEKHKQGNLDEAELIYNKILQKQPNNSDALHLLGLIFHQRKKHNQALDYIKKAIESKSEAIYYHNLAMVYDSLKNERESINNFKKAIQLKSDYPGAYLAYYNLGVSFESKGEFTKALDYYNKSIELNDFADAHWNKALILLLLGKLEQGWKEYEYRFKKQKPSDSRVFNKPKWNRQPLDNKKLLIISEQGFGDTIKFIRYISLIKQQGAYIILEGKKELKRLFENLVDEFIEKQKDKIPKIDFDYYIHLMSLPRLFKTSLENIPNKVPYLKANEKLVEKFKPKFNTNDFKIGITWSGNSKQEDDKNRSTTFEKFKILKQIPNIKLYSLQIGEASKQLNDLDITDLEKDINNFADTAAIIENLDLIISVDTSVVHLAGALNKPVYTLLSFIPAWHWLLNRNDCPWYPSMKLFRQKTLGDWDELFDDVKDYLKGKMKEENR